jgi:threonine dehydratase
MTAAQLPYPALDCEPNFTEPGYTADQMREAIATANEWREAVDDALVCAGLDCLAPDAHPRDSLCRLIEWRLTLALDPAVSSDAAALIERGRREAMEEAAVSCAAVLDEKEEARALQASYAAKGTPDELDRLRHWATVSTFNAGIRRCVAAIRAAKDKT